jgi:two-component system response regulator VicR
MSKKTLTTYGIAEHCQVTPRTVIQWINEGKLKAYRTPGNHSRVSVEDFMDFLRKYNMPIPDDAAQGDRKRILIVDDDKGMVNAIERFLIREKMYDLQVAYDGFEAGQKFAIFNPDLVILDLKMPGVNGYTLCSNIRKVQKNKDVKIVLISGSIEHESMQIEEMGADAYLEKPFKIQVLKKNIQMLLTKGRSHGEKK